MNGSGIAAAKAWEAEVESYYLQARGLGLLPDSETIAPSWSLEKYILELRKVPTLVQSMDIAQLKGQLLNVHSLFPNADPLEVMFFATAPVATPGSFEKAIERVHAEVSSLLPEDQGFTWASGHGLTAIFEQVSTEFYYPAMSVSLALAVLQYAPTVE